MSLPSTVSSLFPQNVKYIQIGHVAFLLSVWKWIQPRLEARVFLVTHSDGARGPWPPIYTLEIEA